MSRTPELQRLRAGVAQFYGLRELSDVTFIVGPSSVPVHAHRIVLAAQSEVFRAMLCGPMREGAEREVVVPDCKVSHFEAMLRFLYTGVYEDHYRCEVIPILDVATKYAVQDLVDHCESTMRRGVSVDTVWLLFAQAKMYGLSALAFHCLDFIERNAEQCLTYVGGFEQLTPDLLTYFLETDVLLTSEELVLRALLRWAKVECGRVGLTVDRQSLFNVLEPFVGLLRLPLIEQPVLDELLAAIDTSFEKLSAMFDFVDEPRRGTVVDDARIMVLSSEYDNRAIDVQQQLVVFGCKTVHSFSVREGTPQLERLKQYNAVLMYANRSVYDKDALGDVLADYVDHGGGVVLACFANKRGRLEGRFKVDNYHALQAGKKAEDKQVRLGQRLIPSHPILHRVKSFSGGESSFRCTGTRHPEATNIALWTDGVPLVTERRVGTGIVVTLNFYPVSSAVQRKSWDHTTDGSVLIVNALKYASRGRAKLPLVTTTLRRRASTSPRPPAPTNPLTSSLQNLSVQCPNSPALSDTSVVSDSRSANELDGFHL